MTLNQLLYFKTISETGSMGQAAKQLFISQPSLSAAMNRLEEELDISLFDRIGHHLQLTPDGEIFLNYVRKILKDVEEAENRMHLLAENHDHLLRLGCVEPAFNKYVPYIMRKFLDQPENADTQFELFTDTTDELVKRLQNGELDLLLSSVTDNKDVRQMVLYTMPLALLGPKGLKQEDPMQKGSGQKQPEPKDLGQKKQIQKNQIQKSQIQKSTGQKDPVQSHKIVPNGTFHNADTKSSEQSGAQEHPQFPTGMKTQSEGTERQAEKTNARPGKTEMQRTTISETELEMSATAPGMSATDPGTSGMTLGANPEHNGQKIGTIPSTWEDVARLPLIGYTSDSFMDHLLSIVAEKEKVELHYAYLAPNEEAIAAFVYHGFGYGIVPVTDTLASNRKLGLYPLPGNHYQTICLTYLAHRRYRGRAGRFIEFMKQVAASAGKSLTKSE